MTDMLPRRRFVQLAFAGAATVAGAPLAVQLMARSQSPDLVIVGVTTGPVPTITAVPEVKKTEEGSAGNPSTRSDRLPVLVQSLDVTTGQVQTVTTPQVLPDGTPLLRSNEALTGLAILADGTIVLTITPVSGSKNENTPTRLTLLRTPPTAVPVVGLKKNEQLESVLATAGGGLLGLVMKKNGAPPARLVTIDRVTGAVSVVTKITLPATRRFEALTQCPDGTLYTTAIGRDGATTLVHLDLGHHKPIDVVHLHVAESPWNNGLASLVCSGGSQLLAFGAPRYVTPYALYSIDIGSGAMAKLRDFDVARVTLSRA